MQNATQGSYKVWKVSLETLCEKKTTNKDFAAAYSARENNGGVGEGGGERKNSCANSTEILQLNFTHGLQISWPYSAGENEEIGLWY